MIKNLKTQLQCNNVEQHDKALKLYGIFCAIDNYQVSMQLEHFWDLHYASLFEGTLAEENKSVAPYLVALTPDNEYLDEILKSYGQNSCIFFSSGLEFDGILQRMRECFNIEDDEGNAGWFLFYNPVVLRNITEEGNPEILQELFSGITYYYCEAEDDPMALNRYHYDGHDLKTESFSLEADSSI